MLRYNLAAAALKAASLNATTRGFYRRLGNFVNNRRSVRLGSGYFDNARWILDRLDKEGAEPGAAPMRALELGTGWMHAYGLLVSLATGARVDLYDVWDNRQFRRLKAAFSGVEGQLARLGLSGAALAQAEARARKLAEAADLSTLYTALGLRYILDPQGELKPIESDAYDVVFSCDVLEHIHANSLPQSIASMFRVLKPGGHVLHQVGVDDHLSHYDRRASKKQYLAYGDFEWNLRFNNAVQYVNRVGYDDYRRLFRDAGFEEIAVSTEDRPDEIENLFIAPRFQHETLESLSAVRVFLHFRKPI